MKKQAHTSNKINIQHVLLNSESNDIVLRINSIEFVECINPVSTNCDIIECLFIEIICKFNKNVIMGVIYHLPDTDVDNFTTELDKLITTLTFAKKKIFS